MTRAKAAKAIEVYFDATRLRARLKQDTPTGIDRVDLAYLRALGAAPDLRLHLVAHGPLGVEVLKPAIAHRLIDSVERAWSSPEVPQAAARPLREWLESPQSVAPTQSASPAVTLRAGLGRLLQAARPKSGAVRGADEAAKQATPSLGRHPSIYINTSHGQLFRAGYERWLGRTGLRGLFFVHDLIPIRYPEYSRAAEPARHAARLALIARYARAVIVNSQATGDDLRRYWLQVGLHSPPLIVAPLGVDVAAGQGLPVPQAARPYFVALGTIEARKNHLLLLKLWQRLVETDPAGAPRLLLLGRRGWENQSVFNLLDRCAALRGHVVEFAGLADGEVWSLLCGARALLNPSFAEGYGLPVAEALALGVPVLASDLPAHREVGGVAAEYLDPLDGPAWLRAVLDYAATDSPRRQAALQRLGGYRAPGWAAHFEQLMAAIRSP